jgi:hypothetical protein
MVLILILGFLAWSALCLLALGLCAAASHGDEDDGYADAHDRLTASGELRTPRIARAGTDRTPSPARLPTFAGVEHHGFRH